MSIVLSILKIIGIILLIVLAVVLFLILTVVFYPICYQIKGDMHEKKYAQGKVSWLFHLIRAKIIFEDGLLCGKIGILWKTIDFSHEFIKKDMESYSEEELEPFEESENDQEMSVKNPTNGQNINTDNQNTENIVLNDKTNTPKSDKKSENIVEENNIEILQSDMVSTSENKIDSEIKKQETEEPSEDVKLSDKHANQEKTDAGLELSETNSKVEKNENIIQKEGKKVQNSTQQTSTTDSNTVDSENVAEDEKSQKKESIFTKVKGILNRIKTIWLEIKELWTDKQNKQAVSHIKEELIYFVKIFLPIKSNLDGTFSLGSPDKTGKLFGVIACFPLLYQNKWSLKPDFETEHLYFNGTFFAKGRIYIYKMVGMVLRILLDKNCRQLYKKVQKFMQNFSKENV